MSQGWCTPLANQIGKQQEASGYFQQADTSSNHMRKVLDTSKSMCTCVTKVTHRVSAHTSCGLHLLVASGSQRQSLLQCNNLAAEADDSSIQ